MCIRDLMHSLQLPGQDSLLSWKGRKKQRDRDKERVGGRLTVLPSSGRQHLSTSWRLLMKLLNWIEVSSVKEKVSDFLLIIFLTEMSTPVFVQHLKMLKKKQAST